MSYNEIPNILIDSISLPNKPLSKTLPTKTKLNECGILNLDLSSGDGTLCMMWFKKGKDKFYFDSYSVQPPSELIAYLKSSIFYIASESNKTMRCFAVIYVSSH